MAKKPQPIPPGMERPPGLPTSPPPPPVGSKPRIENMRKYLFELSDEIDFKRSFAIQWLAAIEAVDYQRNCSRGWSGHKPPVEDAGSLADRAWQAWIEEVGLAEVEASQ
jgi:hypothetical protein